ncbi:MAG: hypothetical protein B7Z02_13615 [Rhodobacterales bacterium 32-67-9]|nr:MAG: hypothetical protein B7Z02_13615 [Rhodobacterales bacterium 32-67-9]
MDAPLAPRSIALINTVRLNGIGLGGVVKGFAADRFNMRAVILFGAIVTGLGFVAPSLPLRRGDGAMGLILAFGWAAHGLGDYLGRGLFDLTGTYDLTFLTGAVADAVTLVIVAAPPLAAGGIPTVRAMTA